MRNLSWIILFPLAVALIIVAVSNRDVVSVDLWPLPFAIEIPLFVLLFAALVIGVMWGGVATWVSGGAARKAARAKAREARRADNEIKNLKDQVSKLEADVRSGEEHRAAALGETRDTNVLAAAPRNTPGLPPPANH